MEIIVFTTIAVVIGGSSSQPHTGVKVVQLAAGNGEILLVKIRNRTFRDITNSIKLNFSDSVMGIVGIFYDLPITVIPAVTVSKAGVITNAILQKKSAHVHCGIDLKPISGKIRDT